MAAAPIPPQVMEPSTFRPPLPLGEGRGEGVRAQRRAGQPSPGLRPPSPRGRGVEFGTAGIVCLLLLPAVLAAGCGRKGPPRVPELLAPAAIADLTARVEDRGIRLGWSRPRVALDGRKLTDLTAFVVLRKSTRADCLECGSGYEERAVIDVEDKGRFLKRSEYDYTDRDLRAGTVYRYRVLARLSDGSASGPSNEVSIEWRP